MELNVFYWKKRNYVAEATKCSNMFFSLQLQPSETNSDLGRQQQQWSNLYRLLEEDIVNSHQTGPAPSAAKVNKQAFKDGRDILSYNCVSAHQHLSPVGAGIGPAQLIGFPHQKPAKDTVEDVSLLGHTIREKHDSLNLKILISERPARKFLFVENMLGTF